MIQCSRICLQKFGLQFRLLINFWCLQVSEHQVDGSEWIAHLIHSIPLEGQLVECKVLTRLKLFGNFFFTYIALSTFFSHRNSITCLKSLHSKFVSLSFVVLFSSPCLRYVKNKVSPWEQQKQKKVWTASAGFRRLNWSTHSPFR